MFLNNFEYLTAYMTWIDRRLIQLYNERNQGKELPNPLKGLVISGSDIYRLLNGSRQNSYLITKDNEFTDIQEAAVNSADAGVWLPLEKLCSMFNLNIAEKIFILMAVSVEISAKYSKIYGYFNDNISKTRPSFSLAFDIMGMDDDGRNKVRSSLLEDSSFRKYICTMSKQDEPLLMREICIDERIINYVMDARNDAGLLVYDGQGANVIGCGVWEKLLKTYDICSKTKGAIYLYGDKGSGKKENFKKFLISQKISAVLVDMKLMTLNTDEFEINLRRAIREVILNDGVLAVDNYQEILNCENHNAAFCEKIFIEETSALDRPTFVFSTEKYRGNYASSLIQIKLDRPDYEDRVRLWKHYSKSLNAGILNTEQLASKFLFTPAQIKNAVASYAAESHMDTGKYTIYEACFDNINHDLYKRASKVNAEYTWENLILPDEQKSLLQDACNQVENKYRVYEEWGFNDTVAYGKGVTVVFSGPPGTGKTMAAQVMANRLNLELFKVDLSQIVSKYVGETEKNLSDIFTEAKISNAILFFDEADALFGKRSDVKSSNDKYSNLETSYLLQKIEEYEGISVLATNYLKNIDEAFIRRMKYIINFPFPDVDSRKQIWQVTMPDKAPVGRDIDYDFLAETFEISGGNIKNILVYAAFKAAADSPRITMSHILKAAQYEMQKIGKLMLSQDMKQYRHLFENGQVK